MSISIHLQRVETISAEAFNGISWLRIEDINGNLTSISMPYETARRMAEAFNAPTADMMDAAPERGTMNPIGE